MRRAPRGLVVEEQGRERRSRRSLARRRRRVGRRDHDPRPRHRAEGDLRSSTSPPAPPAGRRDRLRPRVQRPLRPDHAARGRRLHHDRSQGPRAPRAPHVHRGWWRSGADRGRAGRHGQRQGTGLVVRRRDRWRPRRCDRDDVPGGDRDRPVRRAGRAVRRHDQARAVRLRDARPRPDTPPRWRTSSASTR